MHDRGRPEPRYPGYDVLTKRQGPSWNEQTRRVVSQRLAVPAEPRFFTPDEFRTVASVAARIVPQPDGRPPVPVAALIDEKLFRGASDGYRPEGMPREREAWRQGLQALDAEAKAAYGAAFHAIGAARQDGLLARMQSGDMTSPAWGRMSPQDFFKRRMARDVVLAYYAHPTAWSEIGWGGPASPRGYVRLDFDERDPWEAAEAGSGDAVEVRRINRHVG
ncbi:gluconate 2-dehydrogenase subunit 3 family protein [Bradyrhizobium sp. WYCCWR 13023]|jgi:hypothetical protein|uniref:Gluconate 2-dehydrogenase subunit 3 family protein n=1 Tax=Bradyrhizobium zhengyangense TaxID=2911009 RepID=A0A9X1RFT0_9BRAD|nr:MULTISPECIES: gluconate 2-dehydrogenase subunit 3 family protein [Bradyrhizobium]MCG2630770.1 gluconate 2-dehydrogenase subunit 3 family protein [Bradyrhizobium zhengyangense]MCG2643068.1 gluconate 2-dehydrogenase subunit 3 family protein [Bradyrhizobium zhengyangense]MCG2671662.1 gluconate 2-dehydrogenase subunit 3 family protein [Bradyrhizobium zhengyangense]MDA9519196.1 gluconate 2-dehydrogenase subunit 3 [Bradyrhizobium sp. CCBAU 11434]RXH10572.1 gluconate 2-dehydrogenase subunit 3 fami